MELTHRREIEHFAVTMNYCIFNIIVLLIVQLNLSLACNGNAPPPPKTISLSIEHWLEQKLNHFDGHEYRTFSMKYFESRAYWKPGGPIIFQMMGEEELIDDYHFPLVDELAKETNGAIFTWEHRYYGKDFPWDNTTIEDLKYLSSAQALYDFGNLVHFIKLQPEFKQSKVVAIGGSYGGNLAAWSHWYDPNLVDAALASSAPVFAKADFYEYKNKVKDNYYRYGTKECTDKVKEIFIRYDEILKTGNGLEQFKREENICDFTDMTRPENQYMFYDAYTVRFISEAQNGNPKTIRQYCDEIVKASRIPAVDEKDFPTLKFVLNKDAGCIDYDFDKRIAAIKKDRQFYLWMYQACTEFGFFRSTDIKQMVFRIPVTYYYNTCTALFGSEIGHKVLSAVLTINYRYGGRRPNVHHVVFTNGAMDPWSELGVLEDLTPGAPARVIPNVTHMKDLYKAGKDDPKELRETQIYVKNLIKTWIGLKK